MLAKRIIPTILMKNGHLVKGERFKSDRICGNALQAARIHAARGVDEILILDVSATQEGRDPDYAAIEKLTSSTTIPVTVGGGVNKLEHIRNLLASGADKICIGTSKKMVDAASGRFGSQCIVVSVDAWQSPNYIEDAYYKCEWMEKCGAGEILLQAPDRDGTMLGYDLKLINGIAPEIGIPVIASGGCSGYGDMLDAITAGADAVAAGALFQFTDATPKQAAQYLNENGVEVRL